VAGASENVINLYDLSRSKSPIKTLPGNGDPNTISASDVGQTKGEIAEADLKTDEVYAYKPEPPYAVRRIPQWHSAYYRVVYRETLMRSPGRWARTGAR
jgi:hypothetical protein